MIAVQRCEKVRLLYRVRSLIQVDLNVALPYFGRRVLPGRNHALVVRLPGWRRILRWLRVQLSVVRAPFGSLLLSRPSRCTYT